MKFGVGQPVPRNEDPRFLKGRGRYVSDIAPYGQTHGYVLRSPHAHAKIKSIDVSKAKATPGVLLVLTGKDADAEKIGILPAAPAVAFGGPLKAFAALHQVVARERVRHVGDPVAFVVAETLHQARDAAELIDVEYETLPAVIATDAAAKNGAPLVWDGAPNNIWYALERGDKAATEAAFKNAAHIVTLRIVNNRISANSMEGRTALGEYDPTAHRTTLHTSSQMPHKVRAGLAAAVFHEPETNFRVVAPDVGGGFGMKGGVYPEDVLVTWAARKIGRPVKWVAERSEGLQSDAHGRDCISTASLALDAKGKFIGLKIDTDFNQGAYLTASAGVPSGLGSLAYTNCYDIPAAYCSYRAVYTNTTPIGPYRGAGKPEAVYLMERLVDTAARQMNIDPAELRRRNYIKASALPYKTPFTAVHDSANYEAVMDKALHAADYEGFNKRRSESKRNGKLRGRGLSYFMEIAAPFNDRMEIRFDENGTVTIVSGTHNHGQGHETVYAQMVTEWLGVDFHTIRMIQGDTDQVGFGRGTYGSRSMTIGGSALKHASEVMIEKAKKMAGHVLEAAASDIVFKDGTLTVAGTDKKIGLVDLAKRSFAPVGWPSELGVGLEAVGTFTPTRSNFPNGCHIVEVEVDPETGKVEIVKFTAVDDSGTIINPLLFEGQIHGGIVQGLGQALMENIAFDPSTGQLLSGSFQDYAMPRAEDVPHFNLEELGTAEKSNPLGVKGAGESGTVGAPPAIIGAIVDALKDYGVIDIPMPATSARIWQAMQNGKAA
ncbi:xanthine dehydrogenase family protein molybdopterin-binding subunit [Leptospira sp. severe_002]|uniref:xanthine dehydrogenase family protein molybdopterin-binding subunit n=1 Tax=Leptospira sp. severe_002 TaxID=2838237 RepID=UPI001E643D56|nr:xanthine dehydrogenase family protein molybdopterin-binding subunit [Leptospira sp. severe_002]